MPVVYEPRVVRSLPGRVRIHAPAISDVGAASVEEALGRVDGVRSVRASDLTRNVVVEFDQARLTERGVLARLRSMARARTQRSSPRPARQTAGGAGPAHTIEDPPEISGRSADPDTAVRRRARVAVRGLDRDPDLGRRLVERLSRRPGVLRVSPSPLTGRVLVELIGSVETLEDVLDEIADLELPAGEDGEVPAHPLDASAIIEGGATAIGAGLGLLLLLGRRVAGSQGAPVPEGAGEVASTVGLIEGIPAASRRIEDALGHERKALVFGATAIVAMSASGNPLGLAFAGAAALRLVTESLSRRQAWREYELRTRDHPDAHPGAVIRLEPGQRVPMPARVLEGFGVCSALDASPQPVYPGAKLDPGARIQGATVTLELLAERGFEPAPAGAKPSPDLLDRYVRSVAYGSLVYAVITGLVTRSPARTLTALLLVNPVPALAGRGSADRGASARAIRAGAVIVGSRPGRVITRPDVLLVYEPRTPLAGMGAV